MDILKGIGDFLDWMTKPIERAISGLVEALGINLPAAPELPEIKISGLSLFSFDFRSGVIFLSSQITVHLTFCAPSNQ